MSSKTATYISLIFILILGSACFHAANHLSADSGEISNSYFPKLISYILFGLIIISFVTTYLKKEDQKLAYQT